MYIDKIASMMMAMDVGSEYFGGFKQSKSSIKSGARHRAILPEFKKCESCGFEVVISDLNSDGLCRDCMEV